MLDSLQPILRGGFVTLQITFLSWLVALLFGHFIALVRALEPPRLIESGTGVMVHILRSTPELVALYLTYFGLAEAGIQLSSLTAAVLALGLTEGAFVSEYFRAALMTVPHRQNEAAESLGMSRLQALGFILLPQAFPFVIPPLMNSIATLSKVAVLAAAVGAPEILYSAQSEMTRTGRLLSISGAVAVLYILVTLPITKAVGRLESRLHIPGASSHL